MSTLITVLHVIVCLFLMLTVLLQSGKGGGMGGAFGGSNAGTVFGGSGASTFLRKLTAGAATIFMITSMVLAFIASHNAADALEKFGDSQQKAAKEKEQARKDALKNGAGSGSATAPSMMTPHTIELGSGAPSAGSAAIEVGSGGSLTVPAEQPAGSGAAPAEKPAGQPTMGNPSSQPANPPAAGSATQPATPPAAGSAKATSPTTPTPSGGGQN